MDRIKLDQFSDFWLLSGLALSPNGSRAAFLVHSCDMEENAYRSHIWMQNLETGELCQLTSASDERSFLWLDNDTILFSASREKQKEKRPGEAETTFYTIRLQGGEAQKTFSIPLAVNAIKPLDGARYLLSASFDNTAPDYASMTEEEQAKAAKARKEEEDYTVLDEIPFWENGGGVTNKQRNRLYLYDSAAKRCTPLTDPLFALGSWKLNEAGTKVLYSGVAYRDKAPLTETLCLYDLASGKTEVLVEEGQYSFAHIDFVGEDILFFATDAKEYGINENYRIYRISENKAEALVRLDLSSWNSVGSDCRYGGGKVFQVAGDTVYFLATDRYCGRIRRFSPDGSLDFVSAFEGSVDCFDIQNGRCVFIGMRGQALQEVYSLDIATGAETRLTHLNDAVLKDKYVAVPQELTFTNSDGIEIDGWVLLPMDYDSSKTYPAILDIHGGPKTVYGTVFYHEMQYWANEGYFVFFCNPRGGDGRGNAFADIRGKYGTIDYQDLMEFTDAVLSAYPAIDAGRLGVTGGSYGGFMTNWIIGHTDRFAAAASQRSISNWISMSYTTDIGYYFGPDQTAATAWDHVEQMWEQSPLKYADRCKTPTLFIHSDEDYRCWMAEGLQMFTALKVHGVESRLCLFKGENHELSRSGKPRHRVRRLKEITDWMNSHLLFFWKKEK